eukprot:g39217.t1
MIDEDSRTVNVVYMDFSKAFDKVLNCRLVQKVKPHKTHGELVRWIQNWSNRGAKYTVNGRTYRIINIQRDLGIQVHSSLKVATQMDKVVKKAYGMLAFIGRDVEYKNWQVLEFNITSGNLTKHRQSVEAFGCLEKDAVVFVE